MSKEDAAVPPKLHDVVWAKLDGFPYWPGVIYMPPNSATPIVKERAHVRFFDERTSRAWVKIRQIKPFTGSWHRKVPARPSDQTWVKGVEAAQKALSVDPSRRPSLFPPIAECDEATAGGSSTDEEDDDLTQLPGGSRSSSPPLTESSEGSDVDYRPAEAKDSSSSSSSELVGGNSVSNLKSRKKVLLKKAPKRKPSSSKSSQLGSAAKRRAIHKFNTAALRQAGKHATKPGRGSCADGAAVRQLGMDDFLADGKRRDARGHLANHPEFNPRTLHIPESFKAKLAPAMRQWWEIKAEHFDAVVFFKVGRVYKLYHMDATVGAEQLGLTLTEGEVPHCSVPEIEYSQCSNVLINKGYKVARVEEVETPEMARERCRKMGRLSKDDFEVRRDICRITTKATRTFGPQDAQFCGPEASHLLAIAHQEVEGGIAFGVCFVDTSIGKFRLGQFTDDRDCSRLRSALLHYPPAQVLYEQEPPLPEGLLQILEGPLGSVLREALRPWKEFPDAQKALQQLRDGLYFEAEEGEGPQYPKAVATFMNPEDSTHLKPREDNCLALKALGACVWYLSESRIDLEVLTMRSMDLYVPPDAWLDGTSREANECCLVLDAACLQSLEVLENSSGGTEGTLLAAMDFCCTRFGKRRFRLQLCAPPYEVTQIQDSRLAVDNLLAFPEEANKSREVLRSLPDLERLLVRIHSQGLASKAGHPDQRAVLCEEAAYNQRRMATLLQALEGFERAVQVVFLWKAVWDKLTSSLLKTCVSLGGEEGLPELLEALDDIRRSFSHRKNHIPTLSHGVHPDYDAAMQGIRDADGALRDYLREQSHHFGCKVALVSSGEHCNQMVVPEGVAHLADSTHQLQGECDGSRRALWERAVQCLSQLDCLLSVATYDRKLEGDHPVCTPCFLPPKSTEPCLRIKAGRHPCLLDQTDVSSDLCLRSAKARTAQGGPLLLGGQSTLLRQAALLVITAHLGARVPAEVCELTPVDRIITRLGPSSKLASGEGSSSVKVKEAVGKNAATRHSLVLLDE
ncbi:DNA mismatch repair protein Msh6-like isoform X2 [Haemaphysalis longicornis]